MKNRPFREHHLLLLLEKYSGQNLPLDLFISHYFRENKALGSKDRGYIADTIYTLVRWQLLLDALSEPPHSWEKRLDIFRSDKFEAAKKDQSIPAHLRVSFPEPLFNLIVNSYGQKEAEALCLISNEAAPTTIRVNTLKTTRDDLLKAWQKKYNVSACKESPVGITFNEKIAFFGLPEFQAGLFEVQDEGSQLLSQLVAVQPGEHVVDFCAGSGGKTLAFAPKMQGKGQIFLHDIRKHALIEAKKRLKRAGIQNAQILSSEDEAKLKKLKKKADWVLVDAPCTGTGTIRRNPDMKLKFTEDQLKRLVGQQRTIFEKALSLLKPGGHIVYATCSILKEENEEQLAHFLKSYPLKEEKIFKKLPSQGGMDGFYAVVLTNSP